MSKIKKSVKVINKENLEDLSLFVQSLEDHIREGGEIIVPTIALNFDLSKDKNFDKFKDKDLNKVHGLSFAFEEEKEQEMVHKDTQKFLLIVPPIEK